MEEANRLGMECFSSPFDPTAVDFMASLNMPAYKVASYEITDIPLIRRIARLHKPVILATGVAYLRDIERALAACREEGFLSFVQKGENSPCFCRMGKTPPAAYPHENGTGRTSGG